VSFRFQSTYTSIKLELHISLSLNALLQSQQIVYEAKSCFLLLLLRCIDIWKRKQR